MISKPASFMPPKVFILLLLSCAPLTTSPASAQAIDLQEEAIRTLCDPRAGSNDKITAIRILIRSKVWPGSDRGVRIVSALARQAHYDLPQVRDFARLALVQMVGDSYAKSVIADFVPSPPTAPQPAQAVAMEFKPIPLDLIEALESHRTAGPNSEFKDSPAFRRLLADLLESSNERTAIAAAALVNTPISRSAALAAIVESVTSGTALSGKILKALNPDVQEVSRALTEFLSNRDLKTRRAAIQTLLATGIKGDEIRSALTPLLRIADPEIRNSAAALLNTPQALARSRVPDLIADIRSNSLSARQLAARQLDELSVEPKPITSALIQAVESGDFAARIGLLSAIDTANTQNANSLELLKNAARPQNPDAPARAYARAALHKIESLAAQQKTPP